MLNHFFFASPTRSTTKKMVWFGIWAGAVVASFWWFKDLALGIHGSVNSHTGWKWRDSWNVSQAQWTRRTALTSQIYN